MEKTVHFTPLALTYAEALFELAIEEAGPDAQGQAHAVGQELMDLKQILDSEPSAGVLLTDPAISRQARRELLDRAFQGRVSSLLFKFLSVLNDKDRLGSLSQIAGAYDELLDKRLGKIEVDVIVASRLDAQSLGAVQQKVSAALKRDAVVHQYVDESIIGGLILRFGDQLIDGSVRTQLAQLRERILNSIPR